MDLNAVDPLLCLAFKSIFCSNDLHRSKLATFECPDLQAFMNAIHPFLLYPFYLDMSLEFSKESNILLVG